MKRWFGPVAVGMALLYIVLAIGATGCLSLANVGTGHTHHAPSHAGHSTLCAWACQANPTTSIHTAAPLLSWFVFVAIQRLTRVVPHTHLIAMVSRSRAPPQFSLF
ncbi:MAG: hypothetical protein U0236_13680 [Nitrospira sp.]